MIELSLITVCLWALGLLVAGFALARIGVKKLATTGHPVMRRADGPGRPTTHLGQAVNATHQAAVVFDEAVTLGSPDEIRQAALVVILSAETLASIIEKQAGGTPIV